MPLSQCNQTYFDIKNRSPFLGDGISKSQYCAYESNQSVEGCHIGGGGSLQILDLDSYLPKLIGILSFGIRSNCSDEYPQIFTRVSYYIPWIEANVWPFGRSMCIVQVHCINKH